MEGGTVFDWICFFALVIMVIGVLGHFIIDVVYWIEGKLEKSQSISGQIEFPRGSSAKSLPPIVLPRGRSSSSPPPHSGWNGSAVDSEP